MSVITQNGHLFLSAILATVRIFAWSSLCSLFIALIIGTMAASQAALARWIARAFIEPFRALPQLVSVFLVYFGAPTIGLPLDPVAATIVSLTLWGGANGAEIVRGGINSVPRHQPESARALGLNRIQTAIFVVLPQAIGPIVPAYAGLCTILLQSTTLGAVIGAMELLRTGQIVIQQSFYTEGGTPALTVYAFILFAFFIVSLAMTHATKRLESVFSKSHRTSGRRYA